MKPARVADPSPRKRSAVRDLLTVMSGTAGAQAIGILILPILARAFAPEAFGVFQLYLSLLTFCTVAIALRIELTLLSKPDDEVQEAVTSLFALVLVVSLVLATALQLYALWGKGFAFPAVFLGLGLVGNGFSQVASYKFIRDQGFSRLAVLKVSQVLVYGAAALTIALIQPSIWGLIAADVVGRLAAGLVAIRAVRQGGTTIRGVAGWRALPLFVRRHWEMAVVSLPGALANSGGAMLTPFMIFHLFGAQVAGQYGLVDRAMGVPVAMLVNAGSQVFAGRATVQIRAGNPAGVRRLYLGVVAGGAAVVGVGSLIAYAAIPTVFRLAFGEGWTQAIDLARILVFSYAISLVVGILNQTLVSLGAFRLQSAWDLGWPALIGAVWVAVVTLHLDLYTAITLHALAIGVLWLVFVQLCLWRLRARAPFAQPGKA